MTASFRQVLALAAVLACIASVVGCDAEEAPPETPDGCEKLANVAGTRLPPVGYCDGDVSVRCSQDFKSFERVDCGPGLCLRMVNMFTRTHFEGCPLSTTPDPRCLELNPSHAAYYCAGTEEVWCAGEYVIYRGDDGRLCNGTP